jgi:transposase InsO family protein
LANDGLVMLSHTSWFHFNTSMICIIITIGKRLNHIQVSIRIFRCKIFVHAPLHCAIEALDNARLFITLSGEQLDVMVIEKILKGGRKPKRLHTDKGTEFLNKKVQNFLNHHNIQLFTTQSDKKASIVERFNRAMKGRMYKYFTAKNTYRYLDVIQSLTDGYNNTYHRSIKMKPASVRKHHQTIIRQRLYGKLKLGRNYRREHNKSYKYMIGDLVRITKHRSSFARGYLPNWTEEIFIIFNRKKFKEPFYYLRDFSGEDVAGGFYEKELQLVYDNEEYRVEKVLRRKRVNGKQLYLVQWKGWPTKFNSWIENIRNL